jgi:desulfoferrodoxin (superoxide reductase-like protein)
MMFGRQAAGCLPWHEEIMKIRRREFLKTLAAGVLTVSVWPPALVSANKSTVDISAPAIAEKGSEVTITIHVVHKGNNFMHYTRSAQIIAGGQEIGRWEFAAFRRPENENFSREVKLVLQDTMEITAEAVCNVHGSGGRAVHVISVA